MPHTFHCARERTDTISLARFDQSIILTFNAGGSVGDIVLTRDTASALAVQLTHWVRGQDDRRRAAFNLTAWKV